MSNHHPSSRRAADGADGDDMELVRRVAARQSARLGRPVPVDRDPADVRREVRGDATATGALWFGLAGLDVGFAAAVTHAATPCDCCADDTGWACLPLAVYRAATARLDADALARVHAVPHIRAAAEMLPVCCARDRAQVELRVWAIINGIRDVLTDAEVATLRLRCVDGDPDFELRCLRAGLVSTLGQLTGDDEMMSTAATLANREGRERTYAGLTPAAVWCVAGPFVRAHGMDVAPSTLAAIIRSELVRIDGLMVYPDGEIGAS